MNIAWQLQGFKHFEPGRRILDIPLAPARAETVAQDFAGNDFPGGNYMRAIGFQLDDRLGTGHMEGYSNHSVFRLEAGVGGLLPYRKAVASLVTVLPSVVGEDSCRNHKSVEITGIAVLRLAEIAAGFHGNLLVQSHFHRS